MPPSSRLEDQKKAEEKKRTLIERLLTRRARTFQNPPAKSQDDGGFCKDGPTKLNRPSTASELETATRSEGPLEAGSALGHADRAAPVVKAGAAGLTYYTRTDQESPMTLQPWTRRLVDVLLQASAKGGTHLFLMWPAQFESVVPTHSFATLERAMAKDLLGLRTLLFPGSYATRAALNTTLVGRQQLVSLCRELWDPADISDLRCTRDSQSFHALLKVLNAIETWNQDAPYPTLAEIVPTFIFENDTKRWETTATSPLERSIRKVTNLAHRKQLRHELSAELGDASKAPSALLVVHNTARKEHWRAALRHATCTGPEKPELLLFDATSSADRSNSTAVRQIPDYLKVARENGFPQTGAVAITDDPRTFFALRARLAELRMPFSEHVEAVEAVDILISAAPLTDNYEPSQKSNANFSVGIVDREASSVAMTFHRLAREVSGEGQTPNHALLDACLYVLRLSNMPAGYRDLTDATGAGEFDEFSNQKNAWSTVEQALRGELAAGIMRSQRAEVEKVIASAQRLVDDWTDATPMALRLLNAIRKHAITDDEDLAVVLPNQRYIRLANRFLARKLEASSWTAAEKRIQWHTLATVGRDLELAKRDQHFAFVGVNRNVLRILLSHPNIPNGTVVLVAYRQAQTILRTLSGMNSLEAFKPYRGRIGLLTQQLERRLEEVGTPINVDRLGDASLMFRLDEGNYGQPEDEASYFKFELEGGGRAYFSGWLYQYDPEEDPPFKRTSANRIRAGDFIFDMSDALRNHVEQALDISGSGLNSVVHPERAFLALYRQDIGRRCASLFEGEARRAVARRIHARMMELDPKATDCRVGRVYYWLAVSATDPTPHAAAEWRYFRLFCAALQLDETNARTYWGFIRRARGLNQYLGRALAARYAEILFQPESAAAYRKIPSETIKRLQQEALHCVHRVERVIPPLVNRN